MKKTFTGKVTELLGSAKFLGKPMPEGILIGDTHCDELFEKFINKNVKITIEEQK